MGCLYYMKVCTHFTSCASFEEYSLTPVSIDVSWKNFDDARLNSVITAFRASRSDEESKEDLEFMIPCLG